LLQITYDGNSVYYTTGLSDITATTDYSGGAQTFVTNNLIQTIDQVTEKPFGVENRIGILFTGNVGTTITALGVSPLNFVNIETKFYVHRVFRTVSTYALWSENPIPIFAGFLAKKTYTVGLDIETLQLELVNRQSIKKVSGLFIPKGTGAIV
jgi:hypothetical protein